MYCIKMPYTDGYLSKLGKCAIEIDINMQYY